MNCNKDIKSCSRLCDILPQQALLIFNRRISSVSSQLLTRRQKITFSRFLEACKTHRCVTCRGVKEAATFCSELFSTGSVWEGPSH